MIKSNYNRLVKEQRNIIEHLLGINKNFTYIASSINVDRTTISKEIKRNRYIKSCFYSPFDKKGLLQAVNGCLILKNPPYVCNSCSNKRYCNKHKLYYNAKIAQDNSYNTLIESRTGVDITSNIIEDIETTIVPLIKLKKQSVNQVYANHSDILYFSKSTFYKYVNLGILSLSNFDLPKKVKYKKRRKSKDTEYKRNLALLKGRTYEEYLCFINEHPSMNVCEMDTVEGKRSGKVFLTFIIRDTKFMFIRLMDKKNISCVDLEINRLKEELGIKLFSKVFKIILTDNGSEFLNPIKIERDLNTGNKICNVFYCKPYSSYQKANIERNHEYIRRVFPKGDSLNDLTKQQVQKLETIINNIPRNKYNNKTPYEMVLEKYPELIKKLNYNFIKYDDVELTKKNVLGGR